MKDSSTSDVILDRLLQLHPKVIDLVLDRVWRLLAALDNPHLEVPPVIHIAGTNGKGSTLSMIRAGLEAAGHQVHAYTSPHLVRFHERIRLAGELITEDALADLLEECEQANDGAPITYFEITTVAALLAFSRVPADYTLLEVGLGGRLDATNVFDRPELCVITPVSIDHQQFLGETLAEIAAEKAGILKPGVPCVVARQSDAAQEVIEARAAEVGAPLLVHGQDWVLQPEHGRVVFQDQRALLDLDPPSLLGAHQISNAGTAIAALRALGIADKDVQSGLTGASWPARMQRLGAGPLVEALPDGHELWVDGGHNAAAGEAMAAVFDDWRVQDTRPVHLIAGMLNTKAASQYLLPLIPRIESLHAVAIPGADATFSAEELAGIASDQGIRAVESDTVEAALHEILRADRNPKRIVICGSLYLAGSVMEENG
ncbi:MAG: folylpolyglutamate synthase/dihydrofolate synthase family protein [Pseudomonadota bacterium]